MTNSKSFNSMDIVEILPTSDLLYRREVKETDQILDVYYYSLQLKRLHPDTKDTILQSIQVGDLVAVKVDEQQDFDFQNREPFQNIRWRVGQILTLCSRSCKKTTQTSFHAYVKWFIPFQSKNIGLFLAAADMTTLKMFFRPHFNLVEQQHLAVEIAMDSILPAVVLLDKIKLHDYKNTTKSEEIVPGCYEIPFFCKRCIVKLKKPTEKINHTDFTGIESLVRGWNHLANRNPDLFEEEAELRKATIQKKETSKDENKPRFQLVGSHVKESDDPSTNADTETSTTESSDASSKSSNATPSQAVVAKATRGRKRNIEKPAPVAKKNKIAAKRGRKPAKKNKPTTWRNSKRTSNIRTKKKRKIDDENLAPVSAKKRKNSNTQVEDDSSIHSKDSDSDSDSLDSEVTSRAVGKVLYRYELPVSGEGGKKRLAFYRSVKVRMNWDGVQPRVKGVKREVKHWTINVGDIIAMACPDAQSEHIINTLTLKGNASGKDEWYPFNQPWSPAQVVSMYQRESSDQNDRFVEYPGEMYLQLRWFYRIDDFNKDLKNHLSEKQRETFLTDVSKNKNVQIAMMSGRNFIEVDYGITSDAYASGALGKVVVKSSHPEPEWLNNFADDEGIPQFSILCEYAQFRHFTEKSNVPKPQVERSIKRKNQEKKTDDHMNLTRVRDWSDYGSTMKGPLSRLLECPDCHPNELPIVKQLYKDFFMEKYKLNEEAVVPMTPLRDDGENSIFNDCSSSPESVVTSWPENLLPFKDTFNYDVNRDELLHLKNLADGFTREFFQTIPTHLDPKRCDSRATGKKTASQTNAWSVKVGDVVCIAENGLKRNFRPAQRNNPWYPFIAPWSVCQILSIYRDVPKTTNDHVQDKQPVLLEIRRFLRESQFPQQIRPWMPKAESKEEEEIYETDLVEDKIYLSRVLGTASLLLANNKEISNPLPEDSRHVPSARCRCRFFYFSKFERFQPIFCAKLQPQGWFQVIFERGLRQSNLIGEDHLLASVIECSYDVNLSGSGPNVNMLHSLFNGMLKSVQREEKDLGVNQKEVLTITGCDVETDFDYYISASLHPKWFVFSEPNFVCREDDRKGLRWTVRVGDVVAVKNSSSTYLKDSIFPYKCEWRPGQVISIFSEKNCQTSLKVEIRWFYRKDDHPSLHSNLSEPGLEVLYETDDCDTVDIDSLLGPITLLDGNNLHSSHGAWEALVSKFMPVAVYAHVGIFTVAEGKRARGSLWDLIQRGILLSSHYKKFPSEAVFESFRTYSEDFFHPTVYSEAASQHLNASTESAKVGKTSKKRRGKGSKSLLEAWTSLPPFHVDQASGQEYFTEFDMKFETSCHTLPQRAGTGNTGDIWTIRLGDLVILDCEGFGGKAAYGMKSEGYAKSRKYWPFEKPWAVAEIVTITKLRKATELTELQTNGSISCADNIFLEIRWYYRWNEIPGMRKTNNMGQDMLSEEIFETDHYDEITASSIFGPVDLHANPVPVEEVKTRKGIPLLEFHCKRFWSVFRKSLIPVAGLNGRMERSRANSPRIGNDAALKASFDRVFCKSPSSAPIRISNNHHNKATSWKDAFNRVIKKLSLTDASKEAFEKSSVLIGRDKERRQIASFLRSSIRGDMSDAMKSSIFVAGPPGVGKTASIRAVINELKHEQSAGKIPEFDFVSMNGMEMRHPFEAYVKLWEELNTTEKCTHSPEAAASHLEAYFSGRKSLGEREKERAVVVLLDEIDYLVTKKQSVLYNFFDWPMRSLECGSKNRLIVIGVSNTLNLPERLHPRVQSRIGSKRIFFKSYNVNETLSILKSKITSSSGGYPVFDEDAIIFASKKTAALSGDIRKAFNICRTAAELILNRATIPGSETSRPTVRIKDVLDVSREASNTAQYRAIALCTPFEVLLLVSLASLTKSTGREFGGFDVEEITTKMESLANAFGNQMYLPAPNLMESLTILSRLGEADLVSLETPRNASMSYRASLAGSGGAWPIVSMVIDDHAVLQALKKTAHNELARKYLVNNFGGNAHTLSRKE